MVLCENCNEKTIVCSNCVNYSKGYCVLYDIYVDPFEMCNSFYCNIAMKERIKQLNLEGDTNNAK